MSRLPIPAAVPEVGCPPLRRAPSPRAAGRSHQRPQTPLGLWAGALQTMLCTRTQAARPRHQVAGGGAGAGIRVGWTPSGEHSLKPQLHHGTEGLRPPLPRALTQRPGHQALGGGSLVQTVCSFRTHRPSWSQPPLPVAGLRPSGSPTEAAAVTSPPFPGGHRPGGDKGSHLASLVPEPRRLTAPRGEGPEASRSVDPGSRGHRAVCSLTHLCRPHLQYHCCHRDDPTCHHPHRGHRSTPFHTVPQGHCCGPLSAPA